MLKRFASWVLRKELAAIRRQNEAIGDELTQRRRRQRKLCSDCKRHIWSEPAEETRCPKCGEPNRSNCPSEFQPCGFEKSGANEEAGRMAGTVTGSIVGDFLRQLDAAEQRAKERPFWLTCRCGWSSGPCREDCWRVLEWIAGGSVL